MSTTLFYNEKELLGQMIKGDESAFRRIYEHYQAKIFSYAYRLTKSKDTAQEVVQTIFIKLWQKKGSIDLVNNFEGYVMKITRNHILNLIRDTARDQQKRDKVFHYLQTIRNNPEEELFAKELTKVYHEAIEQLPPQRKTVYRLRQEKALSHAEIAQQLRISPLTVKKHMVEAVKFIRHYVSTHGDLSYLVMAIYLHDQLSK